MITKTVFATSMCLLLLSLPFCSASILNQTLVYDGNGNLISGDGKTRTYNEFNQLIMVNDSLTGRIIEQYIYHPTEDRILVKKINTDSSTPFEEVVEYVNDNFVRDRTNLEGNDIIKDTYYAKDENGIVGEVSYNTTQIDNNFTFVERLLYHNDHLGSTSVITNASGNLTEETFYDPYGQILSGGQRSRYQYEGKEFTSATGDYDFNFRKYNPTTGIFAQPEQLFPDVYDAQQLNRYAFERRNPYKYTDPNGKFIIVPVILTIGVALVATYVVSQGLEFYHGAREGGSLIESYEAGSNRASQEIVGSFFNNNEKTLEFAGGLELEKTSYFFTAAQAIAEIYSGKKSSFLKKQNKVGLEYSFNPFSNYRSYKSSSFSYNSYSLISRQVSQINLAQQSSASQSSSSRNTGSSGSNTSSGALSDAVNNIINDIGNAIDSIGNAIKEGFRRIFGK